MSESSVDSEHSDWTLLQADNADPPLLSQVDNGDGDNEKDLSATAVDEEVSTAESSDIECLSPDHMDADGEVDARSDITASIHSHSSNFIHLNPDELLEAEVQSQASADSISVIADEHEHDLHVDLSNLSSFSSINNELPTDLTVTRHRAYTHVPNRKLNITLNLVLALSFTMVVGLGLGHFLGWSTKWEQTVATIQTMKVQELHDDLNECMNRPMEQDEHHNNDCNRELPQDFDSTGTCQTEGEIGVDEELLQEFNELKNNLDARQRELTAALENIEQAQMKERSSLDRMRQLEEENQELKSLMDEEMANDEMENQMVDKLKMENVQLKEDLVRLRQELEAEIASDQQLSEPEVANQADDRSFREQMNQLEVENEDLKRVIAKLRYVDHPNMMTNQKEGEKAVPVESSTPDSKETPLSEWLRMDHLSSVIENVVQSAKHKLDADGNGHVSLAEAMKAYKGVFDKMVGMSASLNSEQIIGMVQTTLKDSVGKMEKMGLDITGRWSQEPNAIMQQVSQMADKLAKLLVPTQEVDDTLVAREQEENKNQEGGNADQVKVESIEDEEPKRDDLMIIEDGLKQKQHGMSQVEEIPEEKSDKMSKVKGNDRASKDKEHKIAKEKNGNKVLKEKDGNKISKEKNGNKISKEKTSLENDGIKISKGKEREIKLPKTNENKVLKERERNQGSKGKEKEKKVSLNEKENNKIPKEKEGHKESKEKKNDKVPKKMERNKASNENDKVVPKSKENKLAKERENNKVSKGKENNKRAEDKEDKISKKRKEVVDEKATKTSKDSGKHKDKKESNSKTRTKDEQRQMKIRDDDRDSKKVRDENGKNKDKNSSNKKSENSTESSAGMWMFERANQRESSRNKGHEADWYFERKHHEHKESKSKLYVKHKNKYDDDDDDDDEDDERMKYGKDCGKEKNKKSHKDQRYCKTRDGKEDEEDDDDDHHMKWHSKLAKSFHKYKKNIKGYWTSFQQNWQTMYNHQAKVPHHSSYFENFHKSH